jgi:NADPH2:quinone reductase
MVQGLTAHYLACSTFALKAGDSCLIHAGAGGVGSLLIQIAKRRGARVFTTVSTEEKAKRAREAGADEVLFYTEEDFRDAIQRITAGAGVDVVYDSIGRDTFEASLGCLKLRGMMVSYGNASGAVPAIAPLELTKYGSLFLTRPKLFHYISTPDELRARSSEVFGWYREGALRVWIDSMAALSQAPMAHQALESRLTSGKLILTPE